MLPCPRCGVHLPPTGDVCPHCWTDVTNLRLLHAAGAVYSEHGAAGCGKLAGVLLGGGLAMFVVSALAVKTVGVCGGFVAALVTFFVVFAIVVGVMTGERK